MAPKLLEFEAVSSRRESFREMSRRTIRQLLEEHVAMTDPVLSSHALLSSP